MTDVINILIDTNLHTMLNVTITRTISDVQSDMQKSLHLYHESLTCRENVNKLSMHKATF